MSKTRFTHSRDISRRGASKETGVLPTELRGAQVADAMARLVRVHFLEQHESARLVQSEDFLVLERTQRGHGFEALVEGRRAHMDGSRHLLDRDRLRKMRADPADRLADSLDARLRLTDLRHARTDRCTQQTNHNLIDHEGSDHLR